MADIKKQVAKKMGYFFTKDGTTSEFSKHHPIFDKLTYKPFKGAHRGYVYRIPIVGKRILKKDVEKSNESWLLKVVSKVQLGRSPA